MFFPVSKDSELFSDAIAFTAHKVMETCARIHMSVPHHARYGRQKMGVPASMPHMGEKKESISKHTIHGQEKRKIQRLLPTWAKRNEGTRGQQACHISVGRRRALASLPHRASFKWHMHQHHHAIIYKLHPRSWVSYDPGAIQCLTSTLRLLDQVRHSEVTVLLHFLNV